MLEDAKKRMAENVICNLKKRNMEGIYCRDKKETVETILSLIEPGASIGWGGSASIRELGILDELEKSGHEMRDIRLISAPAVRTVSLWERMQSL